MKGASWAVLFVALLVSAFAGFQHGAFPTAGSVVPQGDSWEKLAHMQVGRYVFGAVSVGGKIYAIGGATSAGPMVNTNEVYDTATKFWTTKQPMPTERAGFAIAAVGSRIYCIGGSRFGPIASMVIYDTLTDTWVTGISMPSAREYPSANVVNGKIYVIAGKYGLYSVSDENQMYDPQTDVWTAKAAVPDPPGVHISAVVDSMIYIISCNLTQIYDAETDTWSTGAPFPGSRDGACGATTTGVCAPKRIYVIDGVTNWVFDPQTNSWREAAGPEDSAESAGIAVVNDQIYRIGGLSHNEGMSKSYAQLYECLRYTPAGYHVPEPPSEPLLTGPVFSATIIASAAAASFGLVAYFLRRKGKRRSQT
jgi:hypothetical protein